MGEGVKPHGPSDIQKNYPEISAAANDVLGLLGLIFTNKTEGHVDTDISAAASLRVCLVHEKSQLNWIPGWIERSTIRKKKFLGIMWFFENSWTCTPSHWEKENAWLGLSWIWDLSTGFRGGKEKDPIHSLCSMDETRFFKRHIALHEKERWGE